VPRKPSSSRNKSTDPRKRPRKRRSLRGVEAPAEFRDASRGERLQKVMADAGVASRRDCEAIIEAGRVTVNGKVVAALPAWADAAGDRIEVDGQRIRPKSLKGGVRGGHSYVILNKPRRVISTTDDEKNRKTVLDCVDLPPAVAGRLYPVGRLDAESTGLILLTNDGELANRLTHPSYEVPKVYQVLVKGVLEEGDVRKLREGMMLAHRGSGDRGPSVKRAAMTTVRKLGFRRDRGGDTKTLLEVTLHEGQNREIRRLLARLGHKVTRLERIAIGHVSSKGLSRGQWRMLSPKEIGQLKRSVGLPTS